MILLFRKEDKFSYTDKAPSVFPLISLPTGQEGDPTELNDFQWWAETSKWEAWLKKNPRSWTAEAESYFQSAESLLVELEQADDFYRQFFNFQTTSLFSTGKISSLDDFRDLYEAENTDAANSRYIRFTYALEALLKAGTLKTDLELDSLETGKKYAIVIQPLDEGGNPVVGGEQAIRFEKISARGKLIIAKADYSIPLDAEMPDSSANYSNKILEFSRGVMNVGIGLLSLVLVKNMGMSVGAALLFRKAVRGIFRAPRIAPVVAPPGRWSAIKQFFTGNPLKNKTISWVNSAGEQISVRNGVVYTSKIPAAGSPITSRVATIVKAPANRMTLNRATVIAKGGPQAAAKYGATIVRTAGKGAARGAGRAVAGLAGKVLGPLTILQMGQQVYNWFSTKQAPRYGEVDDFAHKKFQPGQIPIGTQITVCWTNDSGGGWASYVLATDTRTTMNLLKVSDQNGLSFFVLLRVHSKEMQKIVDDNELVMLVFKSDASFEHDWHDNDDLEFETIAIKSIEDLGEATLFGGYCTWEEMMDAYNAAPDRKFFVPEKAPASYEFNYQNPKGEKINVSGKLMSEELLETEGIDDIFALLSEPENSQTSESNVSFGSPVLSFSNFNFLLEKDEQDKKGKKESSNLNPTSEVEQDAEKWLDEFSNSEQIQAARTKHFQESDSSPYSRVSLPIYRIFSIKYVDPNIKDQAPTIPYFVVGDESFSPALGDPVVVEVTTEDPIYNPRFGLATYVPPSQGPTGGKEQDSGGEDQIPPLTRDKQGKKDYLLTSPDDILIKDRGRRLVIKDKPTSDEEDVNIAEDFLTDAQRQQLGLEDWKTITKITLVYDRERNPVKVILKNKEAGPFGDRVRKISRGQAGFETAVKLAQEVKDRVKYK